MSPSTARDYAYEAYRDADRDDPTYLGECPDCVVGGMHEDDMGGEFCDNPECEANLAEAGHPMTSTNASHETLGELMCAVSERLQSLAAADPRAVSLYSAIADCGGLGGGSDHRFDDPLWVASAIDLLRRALEGS